jgi:glycosyltransferase involved in cell wall biosynthesis
MSNLAPTVSVVLPFFNSARFLDDSVASVASQSRDDFELLMVDDGSTDHSFEIATRALARHSLRGAVFHRPETLAKGPGSCRNFGAARASGEFLAFQDSDDIWLPHHLARALDCFAKSGDSMIAYCGLGALFDEHGPRGTNPPDGLPASGLTDAFPVFLQGMSVPGQSLCVRRNTFRMTSGYHESLRCYEDWWLMLQLARRGKFYFDPGVCVLIRERSGSLSRENRAGGAALGMSRAMYRDQLSLYVSAGNSADFSKNDLARLRETIVAWNSRQLGDLACGGRSHELRRVTAALLEAGVGAAPLMLRIFGRTVAVVATRACAKARRAAFGGNRKQATGKPGRDTAAQRKV